MTEPISPAQFQDGAGPDWRVIGDGSCAFYRTDSLAASGRLIDAIAALPGAGPGRPDVDVRRDGVTFRLVTYTDDYFGMSDADVELARAISATAREHGLIADPSVLQSTLIIPGAPVISEVVPFWRAVLGYEPRRDSPVEDLVDPHDRGPAFWFESMDEPRPGGLGAIHVGIWVPPELAEERVASALAAGGRMVRDEFAPSWWTLADAAGNECDIATIQGRD